MATGPRPKDAASNSLSNGGLNSISPKSGYTVFLKKTPDLIPYVLSECDPMTRYYAKVFVWLLLILGQANWLATIGFHYMDKLPDFRDRPTDFAQEILYMPNSSDRKSKEEMPPVKDRHGLDWTFCEHCQRYRPPRSHHCHHCKTCILRRDHHCYLMGNCIGHYNQRYFIPFMLYTTIFCSIGLFFTVTYLHAHSDGSSTWYDYLYPVAMLKLVMGEVSWRFCLLTFHIAMNIVFGLMACLYFFGSLSLVFAGKTLFEIAKKVEIRITSSVSENFQMVFGNYWVTNMFFPAVIVFKQTHDGINYDNIQLAGQHAKVDYKQT